MYFTRAIIKKHKGYSIIECMLAITVVAMLMAAVTLTLNLWINDYKRSSSQNERLTEGYEALMCIDYYFRDNNKSYSVKDNTLIIEPYKGDARNFKCEGSDLRCYFGIQNQPLLYGVKNYTVEENKNVVKVSIEMEEGITVEKTYAKY